MNIPDNKNTPRNRSRGIRPETEEKYRQTIELYRSTRLSCAEICRICKVTVSGFRRYLSLYHRHLLLARYDITCDQENACHIKLSQLRGQLPATRAKYKDAIEATISLDYIEYNVSQIARKYGLNGTNLGRQLRTHYPGIIEWREKVRKRLGLNDNLPRGTRKVCKEQYAEAVKQLRADRYITVQEAAERCNVSYSGLEQHLIFYHKKLVENRIKIRKQAVKQQRKGKITGRGTLHAPTDKITEKYAEALHLYRTTPLSARKIAMQTNVSIKGFYKHLQTWHQDLICRRKGITYEEGKSVDWASVRKYNPATATKYADAIARLKKGGLNTAKAAAEFGLQPDCFRQYLKEHEPELHASLGMVKTDKGGMMSHRSMGKYAEALQLYATTTESIKSLARRFGFNDSAFRQFIRRHFAELYEQHQKLVQEIKETN